MFGVWKSICNIWTSSATKIFQEYLMLSIDVNGIQFLEYKKGYVVLPEFIKYEFVEFTRCDWSDVASFLGVPGLSVVGIFYESNYIFCLSYLSVGCLSHILRSWLSYFFFITFRCCLFRVQSSEHITNFPQFGSFNTKKEFLSIFKCFAKSFLHFWKKKTKVQHTKFNVKFSNYHINLINFSHIVFLAGKLE